MVTRQHNLHCTEIMRDNYHNLQHYLLSNKVNDFLYDLRGNIRYKGLFLLIGTMYKGIKAHMFTHVHTDWPISVMLHILFTFDH